MQLSTTSDMGALSLVRQRWLTVNTISCLTSLGGCSAVLYKPCLLHINHLAYTEQVYPLPDALGKLTADECSEQFRQAFMLIRWKLPRDHLEAHCAAPDVRCDSTTTLHRGLQALLLCQLAWTMRCLAAESRLTHCRTPTAASVRLAAWGAGRLPSRHPDQADRRPPGSPSHVQLICNHQPPHRRQHRSCSAVSDVRSK